MPDKKEEIIDAAIKRLIIRTSTKQVIGDAMDEYMKECCLELLGYMAKNNVQCWVSEDGDEVFEYKEDLLTKEQLFENFL